LSRASDRARGVVGNLTMEGSQSKGDGMADLDFSPDVLLEQARGNQTAFWHLGVRWARDHDGSVDAWATFVGNEFAPSWDELGDDASAHRVARLAALNMATTADMRPIEITGDESRAEVIIEGPDQEWLDQSATAREDHDRANELIFRSIAERRGLTLEARRDKAGLHLVFAR
jgi:hypothetical protein